jgi:hypothetical protein
MAWKGSGNVFEFKVYGKFELVVIEDTDEYVPREGDDGTILQIDMQEDNSGIDNQVFNVLLPDNTIEEWACTVGANTNHLESIMPVLVRGNYLVVPYGEFA